MKKRFLEAGQIVNTHGIQGEVKLVPWCDTPEFLCQFDTLYLDGKPVKVLARRVHKGNVLARLEGWQWQTSCSVTSIHAESFLSLSIKVPISFPTSKITA